MLMGIISGKGKINVNKKEKEELFEWYFGGERGWEERMEIIK